MVQDGHAEFFPMFPRFLCVYWLRLNNQFRHSYLEDILQLSCYRLWQSTYRGNLYYINAFVLNGSKKVFIVKVTRVVVIICYCCYHGCAGERLSERAMFCHVIPYHANRAYSGLFLISFSVFLVYFEPLKAHPKDIPPSSRSECRWVGFDLNIAFCYWIQNTHFIVDQ